MLLRPAACVRGHMQQRREDYGSLESGSNGVAEIRNRRWIQVVQLLASCGTAVLVFWLGYQKHAQQLTELDSTSSVSVFFFSDVHVDPYYSDKPGDAEAGTCRPAACMQTPGGKHCPVDLSHTNAKMPKLGCDPPISLLHSALEYAKSLNSEPAFVAYGGDSSAHNIADADMINTVQKTVLSTIHEAFPFTQIVCALGNNDLVPNGIVSASELKRNTELLAAHGNFAPQLPIDMDSFRSGGFYAHKIESIALVVVVLNTNLWTERHNSQEFVDLTVADNQLVWFEAQLKTALHSGMKVLVLGHTPFGIFYGKNDWATRYESSYYASCDRYSDVIIGQIYGHHSKELIRSIDSSIGGVVTVGMNSAVIAYIVKHGPAFVRTMPDKYMKPPSAAYHCTRTITLQTQYRQSVNPGFSHITYDTKAKVISKMEVHYLDIAKMGLTKGSSDDDDDDICNTTGQSFNIKACLKQHWKHMYSFTVSVMLYNYGKIQDESNVSNTKVHLTTDEHYGVDDVSTASLRKAQHLIATSSRYSSYYRSISRGFYSGVTAACDVGAASLDDEQECIAQRCKWDATHDCITDVE
eukprot:19656-Heterococcus_DN1.PRE.5